jgi:uncharacterized iron-regulated membrane protein
MSHLKLWLRHPQNLWLRRAVFQVHLWSGLILGIYVFLICVTGSVIVFRSEIYGLLLAKTKVEIRGQPLTRDQLIDAAQRTYPGYTVQLIRPGRFDGEATDILLAKGWRHKDRVFDPYLGRDIGPSVWIYYNILHWAAAFHSDLFFGSAGYMANGLGGFLLAMMCVTGMVVWWPGIANWRRGVTLRRDVGWKRFNWNLHSVVGFWTVSLILMWGLTGAYFVFPVPFRSVVNVFSPMNPPLTRQTALGPAVAGVGGPGASAASTAPSRPRARRPLTTGQKFLRGFSAAHYGTFGGWPVKVLWVILGFAPPTLFVTSLLMWWNRFLSPAAQRFLRGPQSAPVEPDLEASRPAII